MDYYDIIARRIQAERKLHMTMFDVWRETYKLFVNLVRTIDDIDQIHALANAVWENFEKDETDER